MGKKAKKKQYRKEITHLAATDIDYDLLSEYTIGVVDAKGKFEPKFRFAKPDPNAPDIPEDSGDRIEFIRTSILDQRDSLYVKREGLDTLLKYVEFMLGATQSYEIKALFLLYRIVKETWLQRKRRKAMEAIHAYAEKYLQNLNKDKTSFDKTEE